MRHTVLAASVLLACGSAAIAQTAAPPADPAVTAAQPADEKQVCVTEDAGGNSRLGSSRKVCHTQKEWDALPHSRR